MTCALKIAFALLALGAQTQPAEEWRAAFNERYALSKDEVLKRIKPPFINERLEFYAARDRGQAQAIPSGPSVMVIEWREKPVATMSRFGGDGGGLPLTQVFESVLKIELYEIEAPREILDREFPGDWVIRPGADRKALLDALAKIINNETGVHYKFTEEKIKCEVVLVRGRVTAKVDPGQSIKLELPVAEVLFREDFNGKTPLRVFLQKLSAATGWPVINGTDENLPFVLIKYGDGMTRDLAPPDVAQIPREQMEALCRAIAEQTGLQLKFEQREITRWKLVERD